MRASVLLIPASLLFAACASDSGTTSDTDTLAFTITSNDVTIMPGEETTKCFYFTTPNTDNIHVHKWVSDMSPGSHHMIYFSSLGGNQPADGTVDDCEGAGQPLPVYGAQTPHNEADFPLDDVGVQLAQVITPNAKGYFQMHYVNAGDVPLQAHVQLSAYALPLEQTFTRTDLFGTYNADINIPPHATNFKVSATCDVTEGAKFWSMSTHAHKQAVTTEVRDGSQMLFHSSDWEHPGATEWSAPEFFEFKGQITWECTYDNIGSNANNTITDGQSARTNEMCMATGYYFPAAGPRGCVKSAGGCQCFL
jgi:hypothetical protein